MERAMLAISNPNVTKPGIVPRRPEHGPAERKCSIKMLVVDAHFLIREALRDCLQQLKSNATILEAVNAHQAMQLVAEHDDIRLIVLELNLPDRDGFSVLRELHERHPKTSVVVLSTRQDRDSVTRALNLGALGFIPKSGLREIMVSALDLVLAGGVYIPPEILSRDQLPLANLKPARIPPRGRPVRPADLGLTDRQADVLELMMTGKSNKEISRKLNLALPTVKNHVTAVLKAIKVTNRTEAVIAIGNLGVKWPPVQPPSSSNAASSASS
jgi:DNA-binding NarL/FixJ family response regulator